MTGSTPFYDCVWEYQGYKLVKRPDTSNFYIYDCPAGTRTTRRRSTRTADLDLAKQRLIDTANRRGAGPPPTPDRVLILPLVREHADRLAARNPRTYLNSVVKRLGTFFADQDILYVSDLTLELQEEYVAWRRRTIAARGTPASNGTILKELAVLKSALRAAWQRGKLTEPPYVMSIPAPPPRNRFLTLEEYTRLLAECREPHLRLFVLLSIHTLQRPGAIFQLTLDQVDLARNRIDFNPPGHQQTNKRRPVVPITATISRPLEQAIAESVCGFVVEWDGLPVNNVRTAFNKARARAGLGRDVVPYTLRHTGATWLAAKGVPMRQIAGMLGHTNTTTTEKYYAKHAPQFLSEAASTLDELFAEPKLLVDRSGSE